MKVHPQIVIAELGRSGPPTRREVIRRDRGGDNLEVATPGPSIITINNPFSRGDLLTLDDRGRYVGRLRQASSFEAHLVPLRDSREVIRLSARWHRLDEVGMGVELTLGPDEILLDVAGRFVWKQRFDSLRVPHLTRLTVERPPHP